MSTISSPTRILDEDALPLIVCTKDNDHSLVRAIAKRLAPIARVVGAPVTAQRPYTDPRLDHALEDLSRGHYAWMVLTSPATPTFLAPHLCARGIDGSTCGVRVAVTGKASAQAAREGGYTVSLCAHGSGAHVVKAMPYAPKAEASPSTPSSGQSGPSSRIFFPCSAQASPTVEKGLTAKGWSVDRIPIYDTYALDRLPPIYHNARVVVATAGSAVRALAQKGLWEGESAATSHLPCLVTMGQPSKRVAEEYAIAHPCAASSPTADALADACRTVLFHS